MAKFEAGNNPADHTVREVMEYLTGGEEMPSSEYDRIMSAERDGKARVGILSGSGQEESVADSTDPEPMVEPDVDPEPDPELEVDPDDEDPEDPAQVAHDAAVAGLSKEQYNALPADVREGAPPVRSKPYTAQEALDEAYRRATRWAKPTRTTTLS